MLKTLDFYFDFYSPYGYLASLKIDEIAAKHNRMVVWRPTLLGPVFKAMGQPPMIEVPMLGEYSRQDFHRSARLASVEFNMPDNFPSHSLPAARAYYWLVDTDPEKAKELAKGVYHKIFNEGKDGSSPELVAKVGEGVGINPDDLLDAIQQPENKQRLLKEVNDAMSRGVFGSPFIFIDDEPFWGNDRLDQVDLWLEKGGW